MVGERRKEVQARSREEEEEAAAAVAVRKEVAVDGVKKEQEGHDR